MDPFTEKDIIDSLKSIAASLINITDQLGELNLAIREATALEEDEPLVEFSAEEDDEDEEEEI